MYTTSYNSTRQFNFIQRQTSLFRNRWAVAAAAIFGVLLVVTLLKAYFDPAQYNGILGLHAAAFWIIGLIFSSQIFMELNSPNQAYSFLTLPVSTLEKLLGSWLISSPLYVLAFTIASYAIFLLGALVTGFNVSPAEYFSRGYLDSVGSYMIIQTIFLWGACYFRKNNFLKTVLVLVIAGFAIGLYSALLLWLVHGGTNMHIEGNADVAITPFGRVAEMIKEVFFWLLGPYMLVVSYYTLKEGQL
jgi:hypothetical protein